jgi:hypothetical protein
LGAKDIIGLVLTIAGVIAASLGHLVNYKWFWLAGALLLPGCLLLFNAYREREFLRSGAGGMDIYDNSGFRHVMEVMEIPSPLLTLTAQIWEVPMVVPMVAPTDRKPLMFDIETRPIRIIGAGYWRKGKTIYVRENKIHR